MDEHVCVTVWYDLCAQMSVYDWFVCIGEYVGVTVSMWFVYMSECVNIFMIYVHELVCHCMWLVHINDVYVQVFTHIGVSHESMVCISYPENINTGHCSQLFFNAFSPVN